MFHLLLYCWKIGWFCVFFVFYYNFRVYVLLLKMVIVEMLMQKSCGLWLWSSMCDWCTEENSCSRDNGGCSHLCIHHLAGQSPTCLCPHSMMLQLDNKTCMIPDAYLLYSRHDDIRLVSLGDSVIAGDDLIVKTGTRSASAIDCLVADSQVFWTDSSEKVANPCCLLIRPFSCNVSLPQW